MKRRTTVNLAGNATAGTAAAGALPFAASARNFTPDRGVITYRITDSDFDLAEEKAASTVGGIYDAANNQYWKYSGGWIIDTAPTAILDGRTYQNPRTKKLFYADSATSVRALTVGTSDAQTELPLPDVWIPFKDSGEVKIGYGTPDTVTVGGDTFQLKTKSVSFTRVTTGTYIDTTGILRTAAINTPRFEAEGLLQEGSGTNLVSNSTGNPWTVANTTATVTATTAPDGTTNGVIRLASKAVTGQVGCAIPVPIGGLSVGGYCAWSIFAKADTHNLIQLRWLGSATTGVTNRILNVNLTTGEIGPHTLTYVKLIPMANGWWRILAVTPIDGDLTGNTTADPGVELITDINATRRPTVTLEADKAVLLYGPQLETGRVASSYIPTSGSSATRDRDVWNIPAVGNAGYNTLADLFSRTAAMTVSLNQAGYTTVAPLSYSEMLRGSGPAYDILWRLQRSTSTGKPYVAAFRGLGNVFVNLPDTFSEQPFIHRISGNTVTIGALDQLSTRTDWAPQTDNATIVNLQSTTTNNAIFVYHIKNLRIWHRALTDQQLALLQRGL